MKLARQQNTTYHKMMEELNQLPDWYEQDDIKKLKSLLETAYDEYVTIKKRLNKNGSHGIRSMVIGEDDSSHTNVYWFFNESEQRDSVFNDLLDGNHWDDLFNRELPYTRPKPNFLGCVKITKVSGKIFVEE